MKKSILLIVTSLLCVNVIAQKADHKRTTWVGITIFGSDFATGEDIKNNGVSYAMRKGSFFNPRRFNYGLGISYLSGLSNHTDFVGQLNASSVNYPVSSTQPLGYNSFLVDLIGSLNVKLLNDGYWVVPSADFGVGFSRNKDHFAAFVPVGLGLRLNVTDEFFIKFNSQYRMPVTEYASGNLYHGITLYGVLGKKK